MYIYRTISTININVKPDQRSIERCNTDQ